MLYRKERDRDGERERGEKMDERKLDNGRIYIYIYERGKGKGDQGLGKFLLASLEWP